MLHCVPAIGLFEVAQQRTLQTIERVQLLGGVPRVEGLLDGLRQHILFESQVDHFIDTRDGSSSTAPRRLVREWSRSHTIRERNGSPDRRR